MEELEVFIVCHDQNIITQNEAFGKFSNLPKYRYLFVGNGATDKIESNEKIIICRNLKDNIEQEKYLVSFTAWYALVKNNLIETKYVSVLEYDIDLSISFYKNNLDVMKRTEGIIGYTVYPLNHPLYLGATHWLEPSLKQVYGIDIRDLINRYISETGKNSWCSSSNCTLSKENLEKFVNWFLPLTEIFKHDKLGAHVQERCIKIFAILNNIKTYYIKGDLNHWQDKSHKIEALLI